MTTETRMTIHESSMPATLQEVTSMAKAFVQSGMFSDTKQLAQAIVKIQAGRELGLPPVYSMQNINMIRNRLCTSANTMAMLVKKSGIYDYRIKNHDEKVCTITFFQRDGDKWAEVGDSTFTIEDAKKAGLIKPDSGWEKYPRAMLFSRAISQGARLYCPDAIGGVYTDEEIRSIPARPVDADEDTGEIIEQEGVVVSDEVEGEITGNTFGKTEKVDPWKPVKEFAKTKGITSYDTLKEALGVEKLDQMTPDAAMDILKTMPNDVWIGMVI